MADRAVDEVEGTGPGPELAMAYSTRSQLNMLHYRFDEAIEWGKRAIKLADELGVVETRVHALNNVGTALLFSHEAEGRKVMEEGLALALDNGFHDHAARAYTNFAEYAVVVKDFVLAERLLAEGISFAARHDLDSSTQYLLGRQAELRMQQGRLKEAETIAQGVIHMERLPLVMHLPALTVLGRVRLRMGEEGAAALLARALEEGLPTGEPQRIFPVRIARVEGAWLAEDLDAARQELREIARLDVVSLRTWDRGELAAWWQRCAMSERLSVSTDDLPAPWTAELRGDPVTTAAAWTQLGLPYEAALALMQVQGSERGSALVRAVTLFDSIEARQAVSLARRLAQRAGVSELPNSRARTNSASRHHPLGLTRSELQVLRLIAEGRSNKDIARQLGRSPRTVEHQVSAVLGKFSAANRMEVMLRLRSEPWLLAPIEGAAA
jgi:DNA-binding CsgD family transcriptional regulator